MARSKKNSKEIRRNDGRKNNQRLAPKPLSTKDKLLPAKSNKAKRERISSYAVDAMKKVFGSEEKAFEHLATLGKDNFNQMKLLMEYAYGKPSDNINADKGTTKITAPVINFFNPTEDNKDDDNTIEIQADEQ